ncbi:MAG: galactokinase [Anaerolineae bacterium]
MRQKVLDAFSAVYGYAPALLVRAPGRANLIGEHTDYNDGFVMPLAVDRALWLAAAPRTDSMIRVHTLDFGGETAAFTTDQLHDPALPHWSKHVRGAWWLLGEKGQKLPGVDLVLGGDIPIGAGMSSSAAIGVAMIEAALALAGDQARSQIEKALLAVELEHRFMGIPCGVMDQIASAAGIDGAAMLLDCRSLEITPVRIPAEVRVLVMNTMKQRELAGSAYAERRRQCEEAAALLGVAALRDATAAMLDEHAERLGPVRYSRAHHVITENERTLAMRAALQAGNLRRAGTLLNASHASLRDEYEVSSIELDLMSKLARSHPGCYGARMMGGGFGGCAVGLVQAEAVEDVIRTVEAGYRQQTGLQPEFYVCSPAPGSSVERLDT